MKKIKCLNTEKIYNSLRECAEDMNLSYKTLQLYSKAYSDGNKFTYKTNSFVYIEPEVTLFKLILEDGSEINTSNIRMVELSLKTTMIEMMKLLVNGECIINGVKLIIL